MSRSVLRRGARLALLSSAALALLSPAASRAQDMQLPTYDVELVIFQRLVSEATPEQPPQLGHEGMEAGNAPEGAADARLETDEADLSDAQGHAPGTSAASPTTRRFPPVPAARLKLGAVADTLRRSRNYRPLAHLSWTQPGYGRNDAQYVAIDELVPAASGLSGKVALTRGRYLHLTLDLRFSPGDGSAGPFLLQQTRRMRSNERHYIDHPNFGVIAVITPTP